MNPLHSPTLTPSFPWASHFHSRFESGWMLALGLFLLGLACWFTASAGSVVSPFHPWSPTGRPKWFPWWRRSWF
jgi:hypothetical protein